MRKHLLPLALILLMASFLTPFLQNFMRETVVTPLLYGFWLGRLFFESIPQEGIWGTFLFLALLIAGISLVRRRPHLRPPRLAKSRPKERIELWTKLVRQARGEAYYKWQLAQRLQKLTVEALAQEERRSPKKARQRLADKKFDIPPEIQAYLQASMISFSHFSKSRPRFRRKSRSSPLDLDPERVVQFLEDKFH